MSTPHHVALAGDMVGKNGALVSHHFTQEGINSQRLIRRLTARFGVSREYAVAAAPHLQMEGDR